MSAVLWRDVLQIHRAPPDVPLCVGLLRNCLTASHAESLWSARCHEPQLGRGKPPIHLGILQCFLGRLAMRAPSSDLGADMPPFCGALYLELSSYVRDIPTVLRTYLWCCLPNLKGGRPHTFAGTGPQSPPSIQAQAGRAVCSTLIVAQLPGRWHLYAYRS